MTTVRVDVALFLAMDFLLPLIGGPEGRLVCVDLSYVSSFSEIVGVVPAATLSLVSIGIVR